MPSDQSALVADIYSKAANGKTAGSYTTDGRWNIGGWSTYPITYPVDTTATSAMGRPAADQRVRR